jgi:hypothetical protein
MSTKSVSTMSSVIMTFWKKNPSVIAMVSCLCFVVVL